MAIQGGDAGLLWEQLESGVDPVSNDQCRRLSAEDTPHKVIRFDKSEWVIVLLFGLSLRRLVSDSHILCHSHTSVLKLTNLIIDLGIVTQDVWDQTQAI